MKISIHVGKSVQTLELAKRMHRRAFRDSSSDIDHHDYMELVESLLEFIGKKASVGDDAQVGHPFYGNQYTEGLHTPKPKEAKSKVAKHAVHELLSSGHPFHIDELAEITGHQNKTSLASWISMFKNDKTAGPKGKLDIVKVGPHTYQVVKKADGKPAPAAPLPEEEKPQQPAQNAPGSTPAADPSPAPSAVPAADPGAVDPKLDTKTHSNYATEAATYKHPPITVPASPMSKSEADQVYEAQHQKQIQVIQNLGKYLKANGISLETLPAAALESVGKAFKTAKSAAMAQWATNTKGVAFEPKPAELFPEDLQLMKDLAGTTTPEEAKEALAKWKKATHEAKLAASAKANQEAVAKMEAAQKAAEAPAVAPAVPKDAGQAFEAPTAIVPEGHQHVSSADFDPDPGSSAGSSKFKKGMTDAYNKLVAASKGGSVENKKHVAARLGERLKASPHFQSLQAQYQKHVGTTGVHQGSLASRLIQQWASSSGDHHAGSVAAQLAIRDAFKMDPDKVETKAFHYLKSFSEEQTYHHAAKELGIDTSTPEGLESFKTGLRDFALAQYHESQEFFKSRGMTHLYLARGMKMGTNGESSATARKVKLKLQPASSFTVNHSTAQQFAGGKSMFFVKVPVEQVMGSYMTGFGCTGEHEVVVLAHESLEAVQVGAGNAGSMSALDSHIKQVKQKFGGIPGDVTPPGMMAGSGAAHSTGQTASPAPGKSYISSPTPPQMKIKVPTKPAGAGHYATHLQKALKAGDLESFNAWVEKVHMTAPNPNGLPKTKQFIKEAQQAIQEAQAEHKVKMEKWTAYHKKHKTGAV